MNKNKKSDLSKIIISMENDKIIYRDTGKSLVIPYEGGNVNQTKPPKYFTDFATEVRSFMEVVTNFMEKQLEFNEKIWNKVESIDKRLTAIENCPTIKKELAQA